MTLEPLEAKKIVASELLKYKEVVGVGLVPGSAKIRVYVRSEEDLAKVPSVLAGYPTEAKVIGTIRILQRTETFRPIPGGVSIGGLNGGGTGTLTSLAYDRDTGEVLGLSCEHVLGYGSVVQPGPADGGYEVIGKVYKVAGISADEENLVDAAVFKPIDPSILIPKILGVNSIGIAEARVGDLITISGRTSGVNSGRIMDVHATVKVEGYSFGTAVFEDQILTESSISKPGDSGAIGVVGDRAVGMVFAGSEYTTALNKMSNVVDLLNIELPRVIAAGIPSEGVFLLGALAAYYYLLK